MSTSPRLIQPEAPLITRAKKFKMFATQEDIKFWQVNPTQLYRVRRASKPESDKSDAEPQCIDLQHWLVLKRTSPNTCVARVFVILIGLPGALLWNDPTQFIEGLCDEDLKVLLS